MKQVIKTFSFVLLAAALIAPASLLAQKDEKDKDVKEKNKKDAEQIIITRKVANDEKIVIEVVGDKVTVNGKEINNDDKDGDVSVKRHKIKDVWAFGGDNGNWNDGHPAEMWKTSVDDKRAMLGVTTEKTDKGAEIQDITKESGAEKAGLKEGDIITKIDDKKIEGPDDLSTIIKGYKPGDKVVVTYLRDKKELKLTSELTKWKGVSVFSMPGQNLNFNLEDMNLGEVMPRLRSLPRTSSPYGQNWSWSGGGPKLGLSVQDTEDGKGVSVLEVDEDGNAAKAGIKEEDVITEVDGKAVNSADEIAKVMKDSKDKTTVKVKYTRDGKSKDVDVKIPRKLKTADL